MGWCWVTNRSGWLLELLTELKKDQIGIKMDQKHFNTGRSPFLQTMGTEFTLQLLINLLTHLIAMKLKYQTTKTTAGQLTVHSPWWWRTHKRHINPHSSCLLTSAAQGFTNASKLAKLHLFLQICHKVKYNRSAELFMSLFESPRVAQI